MRIDPGGIYLIGLRLLNASQLGPDWLVGAFASSYPTADVISVDEYLQERAIVRIRWRGSVAGEISPGDSVGGVFPGLSVPGGASPTAEVVTVQPTGLVMPSLEQAIPDDLKLVLAGAILATTWYFTRRIKRSNVGPKTAGHFAAKAVRTA